MPLCFYTYHLGSGRILPAEHPHEDELHHVTVKEEELCPPVSLRAVDRLHATCWGGRGGVWKKDVFEGSELAGVNVLHLNRVDEAQNGVYEGRDSREKRH